MDMFFKKYIYLLILRESKRAHEWARGRERGERENTRQTLDFSTDPNTGLDTTNPEIMSRNQALDSQLNEQTRCRYMGIF